MKLKAFRVMIMALLLAATPTLVLNLVPTTNVYAIEDVTPPVLHDVWVSPSVVNAGEAITVYVDVTDDLSGTDMVSCWISGPSGTQTIGISTTYNPSSDLWEGTATIPQYAENGIWKIDRISCTDNAQNYKYYYYGTDYTANFTVTSVSVGDVWSSDVLGSVKDSFDPGESVYVTVPEAGLTVSLYVVADKIAWNNGDTLTDVSLDGVETLTLNAGQGTQIIQIWGAPLTPGKYDIVMDVDRDGVFDAELDCVDDMKITGLHVVPEVPLGTIMSALSMLVALAAFVGIKGFQPNSRNKTT